MWECEEKASPVYVKGEFYRIHSDEGQRLVPAVKSITSHYGHPLPGLEAALDCVASVMLKHEEKYNREGLRRLISWRMSNE